VDELAAARRSGVARRRGNNQNDGKEAAHRVSAGST
jgi:hypothetical protein